MAEPLEQTTQDLNKQVRQGPLQKPTTVPVASSSAPSLPPPLPTLPIPKLDMPRGSTVKKKGITITMNKLSLFGIVASLMFIGSLIFLGGFLIGMWVAAPTLQYASAGMAPPLYQQQAPTYSTYQGSGGTFDYPNQAAYATQAGVSNIQVHNVPGFLSPLVGVTQTAVGAQLGKKLKKELNTADSKIPLHTSPAHPLPSGQPSPSLPSSRSSLSAPVHFPNDLAQSSSIMSVSLPSAQKEDGDYTVQLGVYASPENAHAFASHLQTLNINPAVAEEKSKNGSVLYYVYSGSYKDQGLALKAASHFATYNLPGAIVVQLPKSNKAEK